MTSIRSATRSVLVAALVAGAFAFVPLASHMPVAMACSTESFANTSGIVHVVLYVNHCNGQAEVVASYHNYTPSGPDSETATLEDGGHNVIWNTNGTGGAPSTSTGWHAACTPGFPTTLYGVGTHYYDGIQGDQAQAGFSGIC